MVAKQKASRMTPGLASASKLVLHIVVIKLVNFHYIKLIFDSWGFDMTSMLFLAP